MTPDSSERSDPTEAQYHRARRHRVSLGFDELERAADLPVLPIDHVVRPFARFLRIEAASGVTLMICTLFALIAANSAWSEQYLLFWRTEIGVSFGNLHFHHSLRHVINDGLMAIFFFVIGLEIKRELVDGALADMRRATLPIAAALGGMVIPAAIYLSLQHGGPAARGWGIPMATDIAFVVGSLALLGPRVPHNLRVLLLTLAIVDDIGAICVIAVGYTHDLNLWYLAAAAGGIAVVHLLSRIGVRRFPPYIVAGLLAWFAFHESGVHATLTGVILGLMTPAKATLVPDVFHDFLARAGQVFASGQWESQRDRAQRVRQLQRLSRETVSPLEYLENSLHPWSTFVIMPIFALANAGVPLRLEYLNDSIAMSVALGLVVGKPVGIIAFSWISVRLGLAQLPAGVSWRVLSAGGFLAGIGFTMALFIDGLAFGDGGSDAAKVGIFLGSGVSAVLGMGLLIRTLRKRMPRIE